MERPKTLKEHLAAFPHPYDLQATINCPWHYVLKQRVETPTQALLIAFNWHGTEEGYQYWLDFYRSLLNISKP